MPKRDANTMDNTNSIDQDNVLNPNLTKTEAIIEWINQRIEWQVFKVNQRVPSIRKLAQKLDVSGFTVSQAYEQLVAMSVLSAKHGSGYYVNPLASSSRLNEKAKESTAKKVVFDTRWLVHQMFSDIPLERAPGSGVLPKQWVHNDKMEWAIRKVAQQADQFIYGYGHIQGYLPLREQLVQHLNTQGMQTNTEQIITTAGISQAVILVANQLLEVGDTVLVDNPGWFWLSSSLHHLGLNVIAINRDEQGPDIEQMRHVFETLPKSQRPKLYLTNSVLHNPTSFNLHPARVHQVLNLMHEYDAYIFEDDLYASFVPDGVALRYASLDQFERVFYATGFSKYMASGWRVGMLISPSKYSDDMIRAKTLSTMTTPEFGERVVHRLWTHGSYRRQLKRIQELLYQAHQVLRDKLPEIGIEYPEHTQAGMFIWINTQVDTAKLALKAHQNKWLIAPGQLFNPNGEYSTYLRLNVATTSNEFLQWLKAYIDNETK